MRIFKSWITFRKWAVTWSFIPTVIILALVALFTFFQYQRVNDDLVMERDRELTSISAARLREELNKFIEILNSLARTEAIYTNDIPIQQDALTEARRRLAVFDGGVVLMDNFGRVVASEPIRQEIRGNDWSYKPYFNQMLGGSGVIISDIVPDGTDGAEVVVLAVPVTGSAGEFHGVLAGMFRIGSSPGSAFYASIVRLRIGQTGSTYVVDGNGKVIYHSNAELISENFSGQHIVQKVIRTGAGVERSSDASGENIVAAYSLVPGTRWGLISEDNWVSLTSSSRRYGSFLLILIGLGMVLPALGVSQLIRQRHKEAMEREHIEQEMRVARIIQQTLLPKQLPQIPGWEISSFWRPARAVGGDFYDFLTFPDGRLGVVIGDVTDKGVPAALVMASTRGILRSIAEKYESPGQVLADVNNRLVPDMPPTMFVTCQYIVLDPSSGYVRIANAGHNLPVLRGRENVESKYVAGMPLGLMADMEYIEIEMTILPGESVVFYSDGITEAHNPRREMFGTDRLQETIEMDHTGGKELVDILLAALNRFTGDDWEQEDDISIVTLYRNEHQEASQILGPLETENLMQR